MSKEEKTVKPVLNEVVEGPKCCCQGKMKYCLCIAVAGHTRNGVPTPTIFDIKEGREIIVSEGRANRK
jgi:hypothetical protein